MKFKAVILMMLVGQSGIAGSLIEWQMRRFDVNETLFRQSLLKTGGDSVGTGDSGVRLIVPYYAGTITYDEFSSDYFAFDKDGRRTKLILNPKQRDQFDIEREIVEGNFCAEIEFNQLQRDGKKGARLKDYEFIPCDMNKKGGKAPKDLRG